MDKWAFTVPFVCGATNLGEALRRITEGAAMIRSKGEAGTGNVVEATRHMRDIGPTSAGLACVCRRRSSAAKDLQAPHELVAEVAQAGELPGACRSTAGGFRDQADAAMMMSLARKACSSAQASPSQVTRPPGRRPS